MSIKCSLLGHRFGETSVERERDEEGSEVVITITELETCTRCGESRVVSENKEVTTLETPDDDAAAPAESASTESEAAVAPDLGDGPADEQTGDATDDAGDQQPTDDAEILDASGGESDAQADARSAPTTIPDAEAESPSQPDETDDAVIIDGDDAGETAGSNAAEPDDTGSTETRKPGEWPDEGDDVAAGDDDAEFIGEPAATADETGPNADAVGDDGGSGGVPPTEDAPADYMGSDPAADPEAEPEPDPEPALDSDQSPADDSWPEETLKAEAVTDDAMDDWPEETKRDSPGDASAAGPALDDSDSPTITVPEGMFKCSDCGFETEVDSSSLRAGDFCPECRQGTLMQHEEPEE